MLDAVGHDPSPNATIQAEQFSGLVEPLRHLFTDMWSDMARDQSLPPMDVDFASYIRLEALGVLRTYTVRWQGELVGAAVYFIAPNLHHNNTVWATSDVIWIRPDMRRPLLGLRLLRHAEDDLRRAGATVFHVGTKVKRPELAHLLSWMGYEPVEIAYQKVLP